MTTDRLIQTIASVIVVLIALPVHEFFHAFAAVKAGDPTPKLQGRYTINPLKHFDLIGLIMLVLVHFGWAKPVPVNPYNFRNLRRDYFWVSIAGILSNLAMAFLSSLLLVLFGVITFPLLQEAMAAVGYVGLSEVSKTTFALSEYSVLKTLFSYNAISGSSFFICSLIYYIFLYGVLINVNLAVFNLIPVYPLDGFRILDCTLKKKGKVFDFLGRKGYYVLLGLLLWGTLCEYLSDYIPFFSFLDILGIALDFVDGIFIKIFFGLWGLII